MGVHGRRLWDCAAGVAGVVLLTRCWLVAPLGDVPTKPGASAGDAGGPSLCDAGEFEFCDGFEQGLDAWDIQTNGDGGISVDSAHVYRGHGALHSALPGSGPGGTALQAVVERAQTWQRPLYMRFFMYLSPSAGAHETPTNVLIVNDTSPLMGASVFLGYPEETAGLSGSLALATFDVPTPQNVMASGLELNQWICVEAEADGTNVQVWIAGATSPTLSLPLDLDPQTFLVSLGLNNLSAMAGDAPYDAWFDEFAVATSRIFCEN